jgi:hypothetical protein
MKKKLEDKLQKVLALQLLTIANEQAREQTNVKQKGEGILV